MPLQDEFKGLKIPDHVAIIMDGNGRWAEDKGLERSEGHAKGAEVAENTVRLCEKLDINYITLFAFSTENWKRPGEEVQFLFKTLVYYLENRSPEMIEKGVRIRFAGHIESLPGEAYDVSKRIEERSKECDKIQMILAINYGGRQEIWDTFVKMYQDYRRQGIEAEQLADYAPESLRKYLYLPDVPDPDLLIRTSGEQRLSNFLLWQLAYTEFVFTQTHWPDFDKETFREILKDYSMRDRRFGGVDSIGAE